MLKHDENVKIIISKLKKLQNKYQNDKQSFKEHDIKFLNNIENTLKTFDIEYYNNGEITVSDEIYDELKYTYLKIVGKDEYDFVPGNTTTNKVVKHFEKILSLEKINNEEELEKSLKRLFPFIIQPKYDGASIVIYPQENGEYIGTTRGTGFEGDDITMSLKATNVIKAQMIKEIEEAIPFKYGIRLEAYMKKSTLKKLNEERAKEGKELFKNTRNAVAGMLNNKDYNKIKGIDLFAYNIIGANKYWNESHQLNLLNKYGFPVPKRETVFKCDNYEDIPKALEFIKNFDREILDYDIDGLVIKANYKDSLEILGGCTSHHPKNMIAWKFAAKPVQTILKDVVWQVGRTGRICPVAIVEPVDLLGSTVTKATLHNIEFIRGMDLAIGKKVEIKKANDVIPAIHRAINTKGDFKEIKEPTECPICGGPVEKRNDLLYCVGNLCKAKLINTIVHYAKKDALDIEGLAEGTVEKMVDDGLIDLPVDIFKLTKGQLMGLDGFAKKSAEKLFNNIQGARKDVPLNKYIYAIGMPNVGRTMSLALAKHFKTFGKFIADIKKGCPQISNLPDIGAESVRTIKNSSFIIGMFYSQVRPADMEEEIVPSGESYTFCITGKLAKPRTAIANDITASGHVFKDRVTKDVDYLVIGANVGAKKIADAEKKGIKVISESDLYQMLH